MATSNSNDFSQTRDQIITDTLDLLGRNGSGETVSANDLSLCSNFLNKMIKGWQAKGIHLWAEQEGTLFLTESQKLYSLINTSTDIAGDDCMFNKLEAAVSSGEVDLTITSSAGLTVADKIGICLDDNTIHWTSISVINSSTSVTIALALASAASDQTNVFSYTNRVNKPLMLNSIRFRSADGTERPIVQYGRNQFMDLPDKSTTGKTTQAYFSPKTSNATLNVWPTADDVNDCINFSYIRRLQDFDSGSDNPDLPQEWLETITLNLAVRVAPAFGIALSSSNPDLRADAAQSLMEMTMLDVESGSLNIVPNYIYE